MEAKKGKEINLKKLNQITMEEINQHAPLHEQYISLKIKINNSPIPPNLHPM